MNRLFFGDNLDVLKKLLKENPRGFIDLIYVDPPFNSKQDYNILFENIDLMDAKAQKMAFADTWSNVSYHDTLLEIQSLDIDLYKFLTALDDIRLSNGAISYLTIMAIRIWYIKKLLKITGSFYLHCDSVMSHYLKIICDLVFGTEGFKNEITWKRTNNPKGSQFKDKKYGVYTDTILFYTKTKKYCFELDDVRMPLTQEELEIKYPKHDEKGRYLEYPILRSASKGPRPNLVYEYKGYTPDQWGWVVKKEKLIAIDLRGDLAWRKNGSPYRKYRITEDRGKPVGNLWDDIYRIQSNADEFLGYPTQKPITLMERIITVSSKPGDLVADFFCGCGTTIAAAEKLNRQWLGVDISHLAIKLILKRLTDPYPEDKRKEILLSIDVNGFPKDIASAKELAGNTDKHRIKFQDWVVEVLLGGVSSPKKSGDGGRDGYFTFHKSYDGKDRGTGIIEVKSGNVSISMVRSFMTSVEAFKADMGVFVGFAGQITNGMRIEASKHGKLPNFNIDKIQILTIEDLMDGIRPRVPGLSEFSHFDTSNQKLDKKKSDDGLF